MEIRKMHPDELDGVMQIWLECNLQAHDFVPAEHWEKNFAPVKEAVAGAEVYVAAEDGEILGFAGLSPEGERCYVEGIFVREQHRGYGVGKALLKEVRGRYSTIELAVYEQNSSALGFYLRSGFLQIAAGVDPHTGQRELTLRLDGSR